MKNKFERLKAFVDKQDNKDIKSDFSYIWTAFYQVISGIKPGIFGTSKHLLMTIFQTTSIRLIIESAPTKGNLYNIIYYNDVIILLEQIQNHIIEHDL